MENKLFDDKSYKAFDFSTMKPKSFDSWYEAVAFAQRNGIKKYAVVKVGNHYEIH